MAIAQAPRVRMTYVNETTHGTTPGSPAFKILRTVGRNINLKKRTFASAEVASHRNIVDLRHGFEFVDGSINFELSRLSYDDMLESLLGASWSSNTLIAGTTVKTFSMERQFLDLALYQQFLGVNLNSMDLRIQPEQIVGGSLGFTGMAANAFTGTSLDASPDAAPVTSPFDAFRGSISEGGSALAVVTGLNLNINNNRQLTGVVGSKTSPDVFDGQIVVTGQLSAFFQSAALFNKFATETTSVLDLTLNDLDGTNTMEVIIPKLKYTGGDMDPPESGGVVLNMPFQGLYDTVTGTSIKIVRSASS